VGISYWPDLAVKDHILDECLGSAAAGPWSEEIRGALSYVVACIVKAGPSPSTQDRIVDLAGKWKTRLSIGCILCQLVRDFDAQRLESVLDKLTSQTLHILLNPATSCRLAPAILGKEDQLETLASFGRRVLH
jgi:hypothetical protein